MQRKLPLKIYSTWGFHDELGDTTCISEALCHRALDKLEAWQQSPGFQFDYFHLDAFWFDRTRPYSAFHPENFPNGHAALFERVRSLGMIPGLWYSTNGHMMDVPEWADAKAVNESCHGFIDGRYAELFEEALFMAAETWGVRFFKFDFATFRATANPDRPRHQTYLEGIRRFKAILQRLRSAFPDIHVIGHTGFARSEQSTVSGHPHPLAVDTSVLEVLDGMFPGDPHPIDIPQTSLTRNLDLYQDRQVWALHRHGFPLDRIDDHGALMGHTNTCCYRGRDGFKRTCLGQLTRGARRHLLYGNPEVLNEGDVAFMKAAFDLVASAFSCGLTTQFVGPGEPGLHPWHGFLIGGGDKGLLRIVNPTFQKQRVPLPLTDLQQAMVLYHDGSLPVMLQVQPDLLTLELAPEQSALVGLGEYAAKVYSLDHDKEPELYAEISLEPATFQLDGHGRLTSVFNVGQPGEFVVVARLLDSGEFDLPTAPPKRFASNFNSGEPGNPAGQTHPGMDLHLRVELQRDGSIIPPQDVIPAKPMWAGISWILHRYALVAGKYTLALSQGKEPRRRVVASLYRVQRDPRGT